MLKVKNIKKCLKTSNDNMKFKNEKNYQIQWGKTNSRIGEIKKLDDKMVQFLITVFAVGSIEIPISEAANTRETNSVLVPRS